MRFGDGARRETALDAHVREIIAWHFDPATGSPFWLDYAKKLGLGSPEGDRRVRRSVALPVVRRRVAARRPGAALDPEGLCRQAGLRVRDRRHDGHPENARRVRRFPHRLRAVQPTLPDEYFPKGANWLMLGPSGPRRLRLAVEHLAQYRGGICFCVDLDPRWVIKLIKKGWMDHLEAYKNHVIDQAVSILQAGHDIRCMFTTPKLLESLALRLESMGYDDSPGRDHRDLFRRHRVHAAVEPLRARRAARRRVHDADLRQHADGACGERADRAGEQLQDYVSRAAAARGHRSGRLRRSRRSWSTTARPAA